MKIISITEKKGRPREGFTYPLWSQSGKRKGNGCYADRTIGKKKDRREGTSQLLNKTLGRLSTHRVGGLGKKKLRSSPGSKKIGLAIEKTFHTQRKIAKTI